MSVRTLGALRCRTEYESSAPPKLAVVLCHGYGAPGTDLVPLAREMRFLEPKLKDARFYFPEAPLSLDGMMPGFMDSRAWWHIDVMALQMALMRGDTKSLQDQVPDGLSSARRKMRALLDIVLSETGLGFDRVVLGGFSQGAMLTTDVTLRLEEAPAALCILSGTLLCASQWRALAPKRKGLTVFQSHGRQDPLLPFSAAEDLRTLLKDADMEVEFCPFDDQHTITRDVLQGVARTLSELVQTTPKGGPGG